MSIIFFHAAICVEVCGRDRGTNEWLFLKNRHYNIAAKLQSKLDRRCRRHTRRTKEKTTLANTICFCLCDIVYIVVAIISIDLLINAATKMQFTRWAMPRLY